MAITTEEKYLLNNKMGRVANKVQLGTLIESAETGGLAAGAVGTTELAASAVTTAKINDLAVTTGKIDADAVTNAKVADGAISLEHLDSGIAPGKIIVNAGLFTTLGGDANESITASGCVGTDTALVWVQKAGATPRTVDTITPGTGSIAVVMSDDPSTDHKLAWIVLRTAS